MRWVRSAVASAIGRPSFATSTGCGFGLATVAVGVVVVRDVARFVLVMTGGFAEDECDAASDGSFGMIFVSAAPAFCETTTGAGLLFGFSISIAAPPITAMSATSAKIRMGRLIVRSTVYLSATAARRFTTRSSRRWRRGASSCPW